MLSHQALHKSHAFAMAFVRLWSVKYVRIDWWLHQFYAILQNQNPTNLRNFHKSPIHLPKVFWYLSCFLHFGAEHTLEDHRNPIVQVKDPELMDYIKQAEGGRKARDPVVHRLTLDMLRQLTKDWDWWGHVETWKSWKLDGTYCSSCMFLWLFSCKWFWGTLAAIFAMDMAHKQPWLIALIAQVDREILRCQNIKDIGRIP